MGGIFTLSERSIGAYCAYAIARVVTDAFAGVSQLLSQWSPLPRGTGLACLPVHDRSSKLPPRLRSRSKEAATGPTSVEWRIQRRRPSLELMRVS